MKRDELFYKVKKFYSIPTFLTCLYTPWDIFNLIQDETHAAFHKIHSRFVCFLKKKENKVLHGVAKQHFYTLKIVGWPWDSNTKLTNLCLMEKWA
jgi:hypothetical protein